MAAKRNRAFNLAEVIVSLGIFAMMALAAVSLFLSARVAGDNGLWQSQALCAATGQMAASKTLPYATLLSYVATGPAPYNVTDNNTVYQFQLTVSRVGTNPTLPDYSLLDLRLSTTWTEKQALSIGSEAAGVQAAQRFMVMHAVVAPGNSY